MQIGNKDYVWDNISKLNQVILKMNVFMIAKIIWIATLQHLIPKTKYVTWIQDAQKWWSLMMQNISLPKRIQNSKVFKKHT